MKMGILDAIENLIKANEEKIRLFQDKGENK